jgi:hypothetical protein
MVKECRGGRAHGWPEGVGAWRLGHQRARRGGMELGARRTHGAREKLAGWRSAPRGGGLEAGTTWCARGARCWAGSVGVWWLVGSLGPSDGSIGPSP